MAENIKYNIKDELLDADRRLTGDLSLLGMTMLTVPMYNNSMRSVMNTSHLRQLLTLLKPEFPGVFTNGENLVGKYNSSYRKAKHKTRIYRKVVKYGDIVDTPFNYVLFVFDEKKQRYDVWKRTDSENLTEVFGYEYNNEVIDSLEEGDVVEKGTVVYKSTSYDENMNYAYGKNATMMFTTEPYTSEDACVVSESFAKSMNSIEVNKVSVGVNQNDYLLNLYGDANTRNRHFLDVGECFNYKKPTQHKPFPDLGEYSDGEVCVKRTLFTNQLLIDFEDEALNEIEDSDTEYHMTGQVIDIDIYCNNDELDEEDPFNEQILKYLHSQNRYYQEIKDTCEEIMNSGYKYSQNLDYLYKRACEFLNKEPNGKINEDESVQSKWKDESAFSNALINITIKTVIPIQIGQKLTGRSGNKSVVSQIRPDSEMPYYYDDTGKKHVIDILFNVLAIINRTTAFPIYEISINFICNKVRAQMQLMKTREERETLLFDIIKDFNEKQAVEMRQIYNSLTEAEKDEYIEDCINERIFIHQTPLWETKPIFFRLMDIYKKYDFLSPYKMYIYKWGREIELLNKSYIGEMYILKLKQTSRKGFSVRGTGSINTKGLPERSYKNKNFTERTSSTPIRFGEYETLNFAIAMLPEDIQLFHLLYRTSAKGRRELAEQMLLDKDKVKISKSYTSRVAEIFGVILKSLGLKIDFIDEDAEVLQEYNDSKLKIHNLDGALYLCTDYEFLLIKRKDKIRKEILQEHGLMDGDELERLTMEELKSRHYLIGPTPDEFDKYYKQETAINIV